MHISNINNKLSELFNWIFNRSNAFKLLQIVLHWLNCSLQSNRIIAFICISNRILVNQDPILVYKPGSNLQVCKSKYKPWQCKYVWLSSPDIKIDYESIFFDPFPGNILFLHSVNFRNYFQQNCLRNRSQNVQVFLLCTRWIILF